MHSYTLSTIGCLVKSKLSAQILLPGTPEYIDRLDSYWSNTAKAEPACIVRPDSAEAVSKCLRILSSRGGKFAIRSGGHMHCAGSNNINHGFTIDLSLLNSIKFIDALGAVDVGPGALWNQVYTEMQKHQRVVNGGREGHVGVGGFLLGGGITYFTGRRGFACDDVIAYEVILADGRIITADSDHNADLFTALRGGSNNFGIVTRFRLRAFQCDKVWGGMMIHPMSALGDILKALSDFTNNICNDVDSNILCFINYAGTYSRSCYQSFSQINRQCEDNSRKSIMYNSKLCVVSNGASKSSYLRTHENFLEEILGEIYLYPFGHNHTFMIPDRRRAAKFSIRASNKQAAKLCQGRQR